MPNTVSHLFSYPIKGLNPHPWDAVELQAGRTFPFDRSWAIKKGKWAFDADNPKHMAKTNFFMLMRDEKLAMLRYRFNPQEQKIEIQDREGRRLIAILGLEDGRANLARFLEPLLGEKVEVLVSPDHTFSDFAMNVVSIIGMPSVQALGQAMGAPDLNPVRFRANLYFTDGEPWVEFDWVGRKLQIGGTTLEVVKRIQRCAATNVNLNTGQRDRNIPKELMSHFNHPEMGIYARIVEGGAIKQGDEIKVL